MTVTAYVFSDADLVDLRRFCGYPPYGTGVVVFPEKWFFTYYLALEARMSSLTPTEAASIQTFLADLRTLEAAIPAAGANLDTDQAAVWVHNVNEVKDRLSLYRTWRIKLCGAMGVPPGPYLQTGIKLIVG